MGDSTDRLLDFLKDLGPQFLSYLERGQKDRREVAFQAATSEDGKVSLALAFLEGSLPAGSVQEILTAASRKAGIGPS